MSNRVAWSLLLVLALASAASGAPLRAGVARINITPPPGFPLYGYFPRVKNNILSTGTLDPLYARVLVMAAGKKRTSAR